MRNYIKRWLSVALWHSVGPIDLWTGIASLCLGVADHALPKMQLVTKFGWQLPLWMIAGIIIVRLVLSPYWITKEDTENIEKLKVILGLDRRRIAIKDKLGKGLETLINFMKECRIEGTNNDDLKKRIFSWFDEFQNFVRDAYGEGELTYLQYGTDTVVYSDSSKPNEELRVFLDHLSKRLTKILQNADNKPIKDNYI
jgi:hypothetical protein